MIGTDIADAIDYCVAVRTQCAVRIGRAMVDTLRFGHFAVRTLIDD